jgi:hypothetical protein
MKRIVKKTKAMSCKNGLIIILMLMPSCWLLPQGSSETRDFMKTFPVSKESVLEVKNKYGTIQITSWDKDSAYIRAEIKASAPNQSKLNKMFDGISVNITGTGKLLIAQTEFTQNINALFENFKGMTSKVIDYDSRVEINYYINIPEYMNLRIENRYGDVYMEKNTGDFHLSLSNGSFKADLPGRKSTLKLSFCDAEITSLRSGSLDVSFSEFTLSEIGELTIKSISSKYRINKAGAITFESRRDDFFIDLIESVEGNSYFTDFEIGSLAKSINLVSRYGNLDIDDIGTGFESANINSGFSDMSMVINPEASCNIEIRTLNTYLALPVKNIKTERRTLNEDKKEYITTGTIGQDAGNRLLKIDANRGKIYLK